MGQVLFQTKSLTDSAYNISPIRLYRMHHGDTITQVTCTILIYRPDSLACSPSMLRVECFIFSESYCQQIRLYYLCPSLRCYRKFPPNTSPRPENKRRCGYQPECQNPSSVFPQPRPKVDRIQVQPCKRQECSNRQQNAVSPATADRDVLSASIDEVRLHW